MAAPYEVTDDDGKTLKFPYLTPADRIGFTAQGFELYYAQRTVIADALKEADKLDEWAEHIEETEGWRGTQWMLVRFIMNEANALKVVECSIAKGSDASTDDLSADNLKAIARKVLRLPSLEEMTKMQAEQDDDADPTPAQ